MSDLFTTHWAAAPSPSLPGAAHHWQLTPTCDVTGATGLHDLPDVVLADLWTALRRLRDEHGLPGYVWAVQPGTVVVDVVAGGRATMVFNDPPTRSGRMDP